jgi:hypothetical protein
MNLIIASQSKETSYLGHRRWRLPFQDLLHLAGVHRDSFRGNHVTQEWYFLDPELALAKLGVQLVLSWLLMYNSEVFFMFFHTLRIYQNVINEYHDKLVQLWHEN